MIISHFARLNSIFWMKDFMKHSRPRGTKKKGKRKERKGSFRKSVLSHMVCLCCELILLVFRKFNYAQDKTRLDVCVCARACTHPIFWETGTSCVRGPSAPPSASAAQTPDRAPSRMAVRMSVPCERSKSSVAL